MKKCVVCYESAEFLIKGTTETYCKECAEESFADLSYLEKLDTTQ